MDRVVCTSCGSSDLRQEGDYCVCAYCDTKFKRTADDIATQSVEQDDTVKRLLEKAEMFWSGGMPQRARLYYEQVLEIDASNPIALQRTLY